MRPNRAITCAMPSRTDCASAPSRITVATRAASAPVSATIAAAAASIRAAVRPVITTVAPSRR